MTADIFTLTPTNRQILRDAARIIRAQHAHLAGLSCSTSPREDCNDLRTAAALEEMVRDHETGAQLLAPALLKMREEKMPSTDLPPMRQDLPTYPGIVYIMEQGVQQRDWPRLLAAEYAPAIVKACNHYERTAFALSDLLLAMATEAIIGEPLQPNHPAVEKAREMISIYRTQEPS